MISAVILAAGMSRRMGAQKLLLPWRGHTVIEQVVRTVVEAGPDDIVVVTGAQGAEVAQALAGIPVRCVHNPLYANGEMIDSIRAGLTALAAPGGPAGEGKAVAALLCLGDQPQLESSSVAAVLRTGAASSYARVVLPSYHMQTGHPILLPRSVWPAVLAAQTDLRAVLRDQAERGQVDYAVVATGTILADLDTPEDYRRAATDQK